MREVAPAKIASTPGKTGSAATPLKDEKRIKKMGYSTRKWRNLWAPAGNGAIV
jgi:hypothetical protein